MIGGIQAMAARAGRPGAYHVTITKAWFDLIASVDDLANAPELLDKTIIHRYYSPGPLDQGRDRWVEPDLQPLRLPLPSASHKSRSFATRARVDGHAPNHPGPHAEAASRRGEG